MRGQDWIFSIRYIPAGSRDFIRFAVVGPARVSTVETALHLAGVPEAVRAEIRADATVRDFIEGVLSPEKDGYYISERSWVICIGPVHVVLE